MKFYRLQAMNSLFGQLEVDSMELMDAYGYNAFDDLRKSTASIKSKWPECYGIFYDMTTTDSKVIEDEPDLYIWNESFLMLSTKAKEAIGGLLEPFGEFLVAKNAKQQDIYLFQVQSNIEPTEERSSLHFNNGVPDGVEALEFDAASVGTNPVFKTSFDGCMNLYCSERFKNAVVASSLNGVAFNDSLSSLNSEFI